MLTSLSSGVSKIWLMGWIWFLGLTGQCWGTPIPCQLEARPGIPAWQQQPPALLAWYGVKHCGAGAVAVVESLMMALCLGPGPVPGPGAGLHEDCAQLGGELHMGLGAGLHADWPLPWTQHPDWDPCHCLCPHTASLCAAPPYAELAGLGAATATRASQGKLWAGIEQGCLSTAHTPQAQPGHGHCNWQGVELPLSPGNSFTAGQLGMSSEQGLDSNH